MTDAVIAFIVGLIVGWLAGRTRTRATDEDGKRSFRPTKRQRQILETLAPDPVLPSIDQLVAEEARELGVAQVPGADAVPMHVRLKTWKRDRDRIGPCEPDHLRFRLRDGVDPADATDADVRLEYEPEGPRSGGSGGALPRGQAR